MHAVIIKVFIWFFKVQSSDAEKELDKYPNLREFFIRKLKPGLRPLAVAEVVHPCDSRIQEAGVIQQGQLIQAKGKLYSVQELSQDVNADQKWNQGYFITYYLHPRDYHWAHFPLSGVITQITKIQGQLWPVNQMAVRWIPGLYIKNARVFIEIQTIYGPVGICMVGAFNVGRISLVVEVHQTVQKGDPVGYFNFGSTVVVLFPSSFYEKYKDQLHFSNPIRVGTGLISG